MSTLRASPESVHETDRTLGDIVRLGTIATLDRAAARVTVRLSADAVTGPIPWLSRASAGGLSLWAPPAIGEQVILLCPEGEIAGAVAVPGIYSNANPAPANDEAFSLHTGDGLLIRYDPATGALALTLPAGGAISIDAPDGITIDAPGGVSLTGDLAVTGEITATTDVKAAGISLKTHKHNGVQAGGALSGMPV